MATVEEAARGVVAALDGVSYLLAARWVADRYKQIFAKTRARHLRRVEQLYVPSTIDDGTATFTRDSDVVTGDATARAVWTAQIVGRYVRGSVVWYRVQALTVSGGNVALRLEKRFAEDTQTDVSYKMVSRFNALPDDVRWIGDGVVSMRTRRPLQKISIEELNIESPARDRVGSFPEYYCEAEDVYDANNKLCRSLEIYPYGTDSEVFAYVAYPRVPTLRLLDQLPPEIDEHVLREGAMGDAYRHLMVKALNETPPAIEKAAVLRNEYRTQETTWRGHMNDAIRADRSVDDLTFIMQSANRPAYGVRDIVTARDEVWRRYP